MKRPEILLPRGWFFALLFLVKTADILAQPVPSDDCANAPFFGQSVLDGLQSTTGTYTAGTVNSFCGSAEMEQWLRVQADSPTVSVELTPFDCTDGNGVQIAIYEECGGAFLACNVGCQGCGAATQTLTANVLPGKSYYLLIDGWAGDNCTFSVAASGFSEVDPMDLDSFAIVKGRVVVDENLNCHAEPGEPGLHHWLVELTGNPPRYGTADASGSFEIHSDQPGPHNLVLHAPTLSQAYWQACADTIGVIVPPAWGSVAADFQLEKLVACTTNTYNASLDAFGQRPCGPVFLKGKIDNFGNTTAQKIDFEVVLDPKLVLDSTELPIKYQHGDTLGFEVGPVFYNSYRWFRLYCHLPCDPDLVNQAFCNKLLVYGGSGCDTIGWSGASLAVSGGCDSTAHEANFFIKNKGSAPTTEPLPYVVVEDEVIMKDGFVPEGLAPGQVFSIGQAAAGQTFFIQAQQEPGHPGADFPSAFIEGCGGPVVQPLANQLPHNDMAPEIDIDCRTIRYSYDPNEKSAVPTGLSTQWHLLKPGEELEYEIQFQNMGSDTAFSVTVRDTISPVLDLASLRMMGATHPFEWEIYGPGILKVWFPGIKLVDSMTNEAGSKGMFRFRIAIRPGIELYSQIFNKAAIYFDSNPPIITNETWHTLGYGFWIAEPTSTSSAGDKPLTVNVLPSPFHEKTWLEISPDPGGWKLLHIFSPDGRTLKTIRFDGEQVELTRTGLPSGLLFFSIEKDGAWLAAGKLVAR